MKSKYAQTNGRSKLLAQSWREMADPAMVFDEHGYVLAWNRALEGLLDLPAEAIEGSRLAEALGDRTSIDTGWSMQDVVDVLAYAQTLPADPPASASATRGGRLYDKWWQEAGVAEPSEDNPIWARQDTNTRSGSTTWRCKECHGWDYMGAEGAYGSGSHFTGFPGVFAASEKSFDDLMAQVTGQVDPEHDYSAMGEEALTALVRFLKEGLVEVAPIIDSETKVAIDGDAANGEALYMSACTACHGEDGLTINFGSADDPEYLGTIAAGNPWEFIHKVRVGQPGIGMPSAIDSGWSMQDVIDVLTFAQTLPTEAP
ncbi:MAG: c-type cytochrome [Anaerolineales bacterium]